MGKENKPIAERMKLVESKLEEFQRASGIPLAVPPGTEEELNNYLNMDREELMVMSADDCAAIGVRLAQFAIYTQRLVNAEEAKKIWAEDQMDYLVAGQISQYNHIVAKAETKVAMIVRENEVARKLWEIASYCKQRMMTLHFVSKKIEGLQSAVERVERVKSARLYK